MKIGNYVKLKWFQNGKNSSFKKHCYYSKRKKHLNFLYVFVCVYVNVFCDFSLLFQVSLKFSPERKEKNFTLG
jgi:hypothetical protein